MEKEYELHLDLGVRGSNRFICEHLTLDRLLRLNPYWKIDRLEETDDHQYELNAMDHETDEPFVLVGVTESSSQSGVTLCADEREWSTIVFYHQDGGLWARVTGVDGFNEKDEERLIYWFRSVREYLRLYVRDTLWTKAHRYMMNKILLPMSPSQRKISLMMIRLSVLEIFVILLAIVGYYYFN